MATLAYGNTADELEMDYDYGSNSGSGGDISASDWFNFGGNLFGQGLSYFSTQQQLAQAAEQNERNYNLRLLATMGNVQAQQQVAQTQLLSGYGLGGVSWSALAVIGLVLVGVFALFKLVK